MVYGLLQVFNPRLSSRVRLLGQQPRLAFLTLLWWWDTAHASWSSCFLLSVACAVLAFGRGRTISLRDPDRGGRRSLLAAAFGRPFSASPATCCRSSRPCLERRGHSLRAGHCGTTTLAFSRAVDATAGHVATVVLALAGWLVLALRERRRAIGLLPLAVLGVLPFLWYERFAIFAAAPLALGLGYLGAWTARRAGRPRPGEEGGARRTSRTAGRLFYAGFAAAALLPAVYRVLAVTDWPMLPPVTIHGMEEARGLIPTHAVIWSWWTTGTRFNTTRAAARSRMADAFRCRKSTPCPWPAIMNAWRPTG